MREETTTETESHVRVGFQESVLEIMLFYIRRSIAVGVKAGLQSSEETESIFAYPPIMTQKIHESERWYPHHHPHRLKATINTPSSGVYS